MNEELTLAVEEFRQMSPGRVWLIPVRFDDGDVPDWDLGAGRVLSDLNYSDLFGPEHTAHVARLVTTINRLLGEKRPNSATALAAVEQAVSGDRVDLIKRMTKEMLLDPSRRIELDDMVAQEVQRVLVELKDPDRVAGPLQGTNEEQIVLLVDEIQRLWKLVAPFCASLQVAARWGDPDIIRPWGAGIRAFVAAAAKPDSGVQALLSLRHIPAVVSIVVAALASASSGNWSNLKAVAIDPAVRDKYERKPMSLLEATDPYEPFGGMSDIVVNTLARAVTADQDVLDSMKEFTERRRGNYHTPAAEWLHHVLRPIFSDQWPDEDAYNAEFERAEAILGVLAQDAINVRLAATAPERRGWSRSRWYGRFTWRSAHGHGDPVAELEHELTTQGPQWGPLRAGLFGGDEERARAALEQYRAYLNEFVRHRSFL